MVHTFNISECPTCASDRIRKIRKNWTSEYKGRRYTVPSLEYFECPDCGEKVYDRTAMQRIQEYSPALHKRIGKKVVGIQPVCCRRTTRQPSVHRAGQVTG